MSLYLKYVVNRKRSNRSQIGLDVEIVLSFRDSSGSSCVVIVFTTSDVGMLVKRKVTSKETMVSPSASLKCQTLANWVCRGLYVMGIVSILCMENCSKVFSNIA